MTLNYQMLRIRRIEEALANEYVKQEIRCPMHLSIGSEAVAVAVCSELTKEDKVFSTHRAHAHYIAKGGDINKLFAELYGKSTGCCKGRGGSMHLIDTEVGFMGSTAVVGGTIPLAVGSAWADKLLGKTNITVCFLGDGAFEEGVMHEALNFVSLHKLPILFVCENNNLAVTTNIDDRQDNYGMWSIAAEYCLYAWEGTILELDKFTHIVRAAVKCCKQGTPAFLELKTERQRVHCGVHHEYALKNDLVKHGSSEEENSIKTEIEAAFKFAKESPIPTNPERGVYAI